MNKYMSISEIREKYDLASVIASYGIDITSKNMFVCPFHGDKNPSAKIYDNGTFHCFGCGADGDVIDFVRMINNCDLNAAKDILTANDYKPIERRENAVRIDTENIRDYLLRCSQNISRTDYFTRRGLSEETQKRFRLGYDDYFKSVVIPYSRAMTYYQSRSVIEKKFFKPSVSVAGKEPLFNEAALNFPGVVFVVESPICAMSVSQCGFTAIATCGTQGWSKIPKHGLNANTRLILCFDNDNPGREASAKLKNALPDICTEYNVAGECKDPNELLMKNPSQLLLNLKEALNAQKNSNNS